MEGKYKIVRFHASIYFNTAYICANYSCPTGWNPLPAPGVQPIPPPDRRINGTWLFDVFADPLEKHDLSEELPEVVTRMTDALTKLSARPGCSWDEQIDCPADPLANPAKYNNGTVFPWRGAREPSCNAAPAYIPHCLPPPAPPAPPGPPQPGPGEGHVDVSAVATSLPPTRPLPARARFFSFVSLITFGNCCALRLIALIVGYPKRRAWPLRNQRLVLWAQFQRAAARSARTARRPSGSRECDSANSSTTGRQSRL